MIRGKRKTHDRSCKQTGKTARRLGSPVLSVLEELLPRAGNVLGSL